MKGDESILKAIEALATAREAFQDAINNKLILGNDNHIGDIGEYWVRKHFECKSEFKGYAPKKNSPYDIELKNGTKVSVKTITDWSKAGYGTQVKPLCGSNWVLLAAVFLDKKLHAKKLP
jgi:phage protein U